MARKAHRLVAAAMFVTFLAGCRTTTRPLAPSDMGTVSGGQWVVVEGFDGSTVRLREVTKDSTHLSGMAESGERQAIPLTSIRSVGSEHRGGYAYLALVPAAAVAVWLLHGQATAPDPPPSSSCPFVYAFDGQDMAFQAEPYGGAIAPALKRTEWTPLPNIQAVEGEYRIRIANELDETQHTDEARLVVVDHPPGTQVAADPSGGIHLFEDPMPPRTAWDEQGRDLTFTLQRADQLAWYSRYEEMDDRTRETLKNALTLEFSKPANASTARLLVNGATAPWGAQVAGEFLSLRGHGLDEWYAELDRQGPTLLSLLGWFSREGLYTLPIEVETPTGWQPRGTLFGSGPFAYKSTAYELDVSDVPGETLRIRLPTPVNFWVFNSVGVDYGEEARIEVQEVETSTTRDLKGRETRQLLAATDGSSLVMAENGDYSDLTFPAPPERPGLARTVLLKISGYYEIHVPAEGEPQEALLQRVLLEPGYTLQFAYDRYLAQASRPDSTWHR